MRSGEPRLPPSIQVSYREPPCCQRCAVPESPCRAVRPITPPLMLSAGGFQDASSQGLWTTESDSLLARDPSWYVPSHRSGPRQRPPAKSRLGGISRRRELTPLRRFGDAIAGVFRRPRSDRDELHEEGGRSGYARNGRGSVATARRVGGQGPTIGPRLWARSRDLLHEDPISRVRGSHLQLDLGLD